MTKVTYDFSGMGAVAINATQVDQNFSDLTSAIDQITTANIATTAGIVSTQLADRYALSMLGPFDLLPFSSGSNFSSPGNFTLPDSPTTFLKHKMLVKPGRRAYLVKMEVHCIAVGTSKPTVTVEVGGVTLGGGAQTISLAGFTYIQNSNPVDNPMVILNNDDIIEMKIGSASSAAEARGLSVTLWIKEELVP